MLILFFILHCIEDYVESYIEIDTNTNKVLIIDGMTVANQTDSKTLSTCQDFEIAFMSRIGNMVSCYTKVRLIFDRYLIFRTSSESKNKRSKNSWSSNKVLQNIFVLDYNESKIGNIFFIYRKELY